MNTAGSEELLFFFAGTSTGLTLASLEFDLDNNNKKKKTKECE